MTSSFHTGGTHDGSFALSVLALNAGLRICFRAAGSSSTVRFAFVAAPFVAAPFFAALFFVGLFVEAFFFATLFFALFRALFFTLFFFAPRFVATSGFEFRRLAME
jgi:hypothetical protein